MAGTLSWSCPFETVHSYHKFMMKYMLHTEHNGEKIRPQQALIISGVLACSAFRVRIF